VKRLIFQKCKIFVAGLVNAVWQTPYGLHMSFRDLLFAENQERKVTLSHFERSLICWKSTM